MEVLALEAFEPVDTKVQARFDEFDIGSLSQCVIYDTLILVHSNRTSRIDDITACGRIRVDRVNGTKNQLLLQVSEKLEVPFGLINRLSVKSH